MARRRHVVAYDIADPGRLRIVHGIVKRFGYALQYSVFICDLDAVERTHLRWELGEVIAHNEDRVAIIDVGDVRNPTCFDFLGVMPRLPTQGPLIV